jgi:alanine dehydrogenase
MPADLTLGVLGRARKPDERRLPIHPEHLAHIADGLRGRILLEAGYGEAFGVGDGALRALVGGVLPREEVVARADVVVLPKPGVEDLAAFREGQVLWGWPHAVQDAALAQVAIDRRLTLIAWEAMHRWDSRGGFEQHVFHANNELAGYCSVLHALQLIGRTGAFGRPLRAGVISFGSTGRGAVRALAALGVADITLYSRRDSAMVERPSATVALRHFGRDPGDSALAVVDDPEGPDRPMAEALAEHDIVVNCFLQDTDRPLLFVPDAGALPAGRLVVDVSVDPGMGFGWAQATSFAEPLLRVGPDGRVAYYAVDHSPSLLFDSATWAISEAVLGFLPAIMGGPEAWEADETVRRAVEIRDGTVVNPAILRFQGREEAWPHRRAEG